MLAPAGYGLVVVDIINKVILTQQGYTDLGVIYPVQIALTMSQREHFPERGTEQHDDDLDRLLKFHKAGRVKTIKVWDREAKTMREQEFPQDMTIDDMLASCQGYRKNGWAGLIMDMSPYQIEKFPERNAQASEQMRQRILDLGFPLTESDEQGWREWVQLCRRDR
jgi:hypothetical protein